MTYQLRSINGVHRGRTHSVFADSNLPIPSRPEGIVPRYLTPPHIIMIKILRRRQLQSVDYPISQHRAIPTQHSRRRYSSSPPDIDSKAIKSCLPAGTCSADDIMIHVSSRRILSRSITNLLPPAAIIYFQISLTPYSLSMFWIHTWETYSDRFESAGG